MEATMKQLLFLLPLTMANLTGYSRVGVERYCQINASDKTLQCNYASAADCLDYLQKGEACVVDDRRQGNDQWSTAPLANTLLLERWAKGQGLGQIH